MKEVPMLFHRDTIDKLDRSEVNRLASEKPETTAERDRITQKLAILQSCLNDLRRLDNHQISLEGKLVVLLDMYKLIGRLTSCCVIDSPSEAERTPTDINSTPRSGSSIEPVNTTGLVSDLEAPAAEAEHATPIPAVEDIPPQSVDESDFFTSTLSSMKEKKMKKKLKRQAEAARYSWADPVATEET
jgi:hypothetical protein